MSRTLETMACAPTPHQKDAQPSDRKGAHS